MVSNFIFLSNGGEANKDSKMEGEFIIHDYVVYIKPHNNQSWWWILQKLDMVNGLHRYYTQAIQEAHEEITKYEWYNFKFGNHH